MGKYLVTGGCGFIGSHLANTLVSQGHSVRVIDDLSSGKKKNLSPEVELIIGNILNKKILKSALEGIDGCFHLAAIVSVEKTIREWSSSHLVNQGAAVTLFESLVEIGLKIPVIFTSTSAVYGHPDTIPTKESSALHPLSPYGIDKLGSEQHACLASSLHSIPITIFRLFNVYGPKQEASSPYSGVISLFTTNILKQKPLMIYGSGEQKRDFIHVYDVVRYLIAGLRKKTDTSSRIFNLCTGKSITINQLAELVEKIAQKKAEKIYAPSRSGEVFSSIGDPSQAEIFFGIKAEYSLEEGIHSLINFNLGNVCVGDGY